MNNDLEKLKQLLMNHEKEFKLKFEIKRQLMEKNIQEKNRAIKLKINEMMNKDAGQSEKYKKKYNLLSELENTKKELEEIKLQHRDRMNNLKKERLDAMDFIKNKISKNLDSLVDNEDIKNAIDKFDINIDKI